MFGLPGWQRVALAALLVIPLILLLVLMTPAWLMLPILSEQRRSDLLKLVRMLIEWVRVVAGATQPPRAQLDDDNEKDEQHKNDHERDEAR